MRIILDLSRHCIETEIRKRYNSALSDYFRKGGEDESLEARIEALESALRQLDFSDLRYRHEKLRGGMDTDARLTVKDDGSVQIILEGNIVAPI